MFDCVLWAGDINENFKRKTRFFPSQTGINQQARPACKKNLFDQFDYEYRE